MSDKKPRMRGFNVRMPNELIGDLEKIADYEHVDRSDVIRRLLINAVKEHRATYTTPRKKKDDTDA
jgi:metal-responsive CopG/Arc/MetJ family transcriptional regulator